MAGTYRSFLRKTVLWMAVTVLALGLLGVGLGTAFASEVCDSSLDGETIEADLVENTTVDDDIDPKQVNLSDDPDTITGDGFSRLFERLLEDEACRRWFESAGD